MTRIKEKAVEMIQRMPDDNMFYIINILQNLEEMTANKGNDREQAMTALQEILKFSGRLPENFDADKELAEAREEKYGILVDTNILVDIIANRMPYAEHGKKDNGKMCQKGSYRNYGGS